MADDEKIKVKVSDASGSKIVHAELPLNAPVDRLIQALVARMPLPKDVQYHMQHKASGKVLKMDETLALAGIKADDTLRLVPTVTAG